MQSWVESSLKVRKIAPGGGESEDESEESDLYSWTTWFRSREDESGYSEKES